MVKNEVSGYIVGWGGVGLDTRGEAKAVKR